MSRKMFGAFTACVISLFFLLPDQTEAAKKVEICHVPNGNSDNANTIRISESALNTHLSHGDTIGSCTADFVVDVRSNRTYGVVGTEFVLNAIAVFAPTPDIGYRWEIGDGRSFDGPSISIAFGEAGYYPVTLIATHSSGAVSQAELGLVVHDPDNPSPDVLGLPDQMGDINGDGEITLHDAHLAAKFAGRLEPLDSSAQRASDMDFSGDVTFADVNLISSAVLADADLPDQLISDSGTPGSIVTLVSPALLNPGDLVQIRVGASGSLQTPTRPILGYTSFIVPFVGEAASPGQKDVTLFVNGTEAAMYSFAVLDPEPLPDNPVAELTGLFDDILSLLAINEQALADQLDEVGVSDETRSILLATAVAGRLESESVIEQLREMLDRGDGEQLASAFFLAANPNGLSEYREDLKAFIQSYSGTDGSAELSSAEFMTFAAVSPDEVCDKLLPALCALKTASSLLDTGSGIVSGACDILLAAGLGAVVFPGDGPVLDGALLTSWATVCAPLEFAIDAAAVVTDLVSDIDADMRLSTSTASPAAGEAAIIKASLDVFGLDDVCQLGGSEAADKLVEKLAERAVHRLIKRKVTVRAMHKIFEQLGGDFLNKFLLLLQKGAKEAIKATDIDDAILRFAQPYCEDIYGAELVMNASRMLTGPEPQEGALAFQADGTAEYMCPSSAGTTDPLSVTLTAQKDICGTEQTKTVDIHCAGRDVTITMGDNGNLNDDIYEVRLNGETVLTTSSPVRSASTTVQLGVGTIAQVQMLGRAAPDGVGTYFISFSGARVIAGDPTSGTDLVPGAIKNYTIEVLP